MDSTIDLVDSLSITETMKIALPWDRSVSINQKVEFTPEPSIFGSRVQMSFTFAASMDISDEVLVDKRIRDRAVRDMRVRMKLGLFNDTLAFLREMQDIAYKKCDMEMLNKVESFKRRIYDAGAAS